MSITDLVFDPAEARDPHGRWFHGTSDVHGPGDVIDPSVEHRANFDPEHSEPKSVYIARKPKTAMHYAERDKGGLGEPHVYEVEPLGPHWTVAKGSGQHQTKSPIRIIRELPPGEREADLPAGSYTRPEPGEMEYNLAWHFNPAELRGYHGKWEGRDVEVPSMTPADGRKPLDQPGRTNGAGTPEDPIDVAGDMGRAVDLMAAGKHVRLNGPDELPALADEINRRADAEGVSVGHNLPWDLGNISVRGTRLFNEQTTGISRANMPQLAGPAEPGSEAALLAGGANKFFIADPEFRRQLERDHISVTNERVPADDLRATQTQLTATEVAGIARAAAKGVPAVTKMLREPIWVTSDNYVIDGHHRWAAGEMLAAMQHNFPGRQINVQRIGLPVAQAIPYANHFAERIGIASAKLGGKQKLAAANLTEQALELSLEAWLTEKRGYHGEWVGRSGGLAMQTLGIKSKQGWIRVPDEPGYGKLPPGLKPPKNRKEAIGALNMLGSMTAMSDRHSLLHRIGGFLNETAGEGGETESPVPEAARTFTLASADKVAGIYGDTPGHETFSGRVTEGSNLLGGTRQSGALAYLDWNGDLHLRQDVVEKGLAHESEGGPWQVGSAEVLLHELTHGITDRPNRQVEDKEAYQSSRDAADAEEGFTELGARLHAHEFFGQMGIADHDSGSTDDDGHPLTMGGLADIGATRENILGDNPVWDHYPKQVQAAYRWAEQVAQQQGTSVQQVVDDMNGLGTASKLSYINQAGVPWGAAASKRAKWGLA